MEKQTIDTSLYSAITDAVRAEAARVLSEGKVTAVVGYAAGRRKGSSQPIIITEAAQAEKLIFSASCVNNLAVYLTKAKKEVSQTGVIGILVKSCDLKALVGLMSEAQLKRENLYVIGVPCIGVLASIANPSTELSSDSIAAKCLECSTPVPPGVDFVPTVTLPTAQPKKSKYEAEVARLEAMTPAERWAFWKDQFSKCIKCFACRQVCPFCYCEQCLCDRNKPQMVETTPRPSGNLSWHLVRAMHLAGRCAGCCECERVCPMDIPLNLLNRKMAKELQDMFKHEAGFEVEEKGPLTSYADKDDESFIK